MRPRIRRSAMVYQGLSLVGTSAEATITATIVAIVRDWGTIEIVVRATMMVDARIRTARGAT